VSCPKETLIGRRAKMLHDLSQHEAFPGSSDLWVPLEIALVTDIQQSLTCRF
jgi:hypothetical protein